MEFVVEVAGVSGDPASASSVAVVVVVVVEEEAAVDFLEGRLRVDFVFDELVPVADLLEVFLRLLAGGAKSASPLASEP